ncbi:MAG: hypothetical protein H6815_11600 [Phycisphaeraceae bacterium]|nr:hypothetical protein [Phycisphaerales bacterium]MCB9861083.1 hypothetical protein [Phycisphaeraceae bacterium]
MPSGFFRPRSVRCLALIAAAGLAGVCASSVADSVDPTSVTALQAAYPGVRVYANDAVSNGWNTKFYGKPMTTGATPQAAVNAWLAQHDTAFGAGKLELSLDHVVQIMEDKFTAFQYSQSRNGVPVEHGQLIVLVLNKVASPRNIDEVVYVSGTLADEVVNGPAPVLGEAQSINAARRIGEFTHLTLWTQPQLVVYFGETIREEARLAWKTTGAVDTAVHGLEHMDGWTVFVDAQTGKVLHTRTEVLNYDPEQVDVSGTVRGNGSPGTLPDIATNPPQPMALPILRVDQSGGNSAYTDADGHYTIPFGGTGSVSINSSLDNGQWVNINNNGTGGVLTASGTFTAGPNADLLFNQTPTEHLTSQINVFAHTTIAHNYITDRAPSYTALDINIDANCNINDVCNAGYTNVGGHSINFFRSGGGCVNSGYAGVISHEYGHFMVNRRSLSQGAFGEGFGDTCSILIFDDPILGRGFYGPGTVVRDPVGENLQYPCSGAIHFCGMLLGGTWWDIRQNMGTTYGSQPGLELTRDLHVAWYLITSGGQGSNSAHPGTAIEVLTVDDNDGNLENGTPNYNEICAAFSSHSIDCPELLLLSFSYPAGMPSELTPQQPTSFLVDVAGLNGTPAANSGELVYRVDGGVFTTVAMNSVGTNQYQAVLPGVPCTSVVEYYVRAGATNGGVQTDPSNAPASLFTAVAGQVSVAIDDNFQTNMGWTAANLGATTGDWQRGVPVNDPSWAYDPESDSDGSGSCYLTQNQTGNTDVDDGAVELTSPTIDMSGEAVIGSYDYYLNLTDSSTDRLRVEVNNNDGVGAWTVLVDHNTNNGLEWTTHTFTGDDLLAVGVAPTSTMRLRFTANDSNPQSIVESGLDAVRVRNVSCGVACYADCDGSGTLNVFDYICFGNAYASNDPYADCDNSGGLNVFDYICFGNEYAAGCP